MNLKLRFTFISPSVFNIMGYTQEEWIGTKLSSHASFSEFVKMGRKVLEGIHDYKGKHIRIFDAVLRHKDGSLVHVEIAGRIIFDKNGFPKEVVGGTRDITRRK